MPRLLSGRQPSVKIGIPSYSEDLTTLSVVGISSLQKLSVDGSTGTDGQYLRSTGTGLKWEDFLTSTLREEETFTATGGQTTFILNYNVGFIDVFVNGVRLTSSEYSSFSGTFITVYEALFEGDTVDIIKYNTSVTGVSLGNSETDTLDSVIARGSTTTSGIQVGDLRSTEAVYTDIIRRQTDNSSTTKITLETNSIRLFAGHGTTPKIRINGNVNITTDLNVVGVSTFADQTNHSTIMASGTITAKDFNSTSDVKLKENINQIEEPISKIMSIEGVSFNWKSDDRPSLGVIANQLENTLPELVSGDNIKSVNYNGLVGLLIECVKNQQKQVEELKGQLSILAGSTSFKDFKKKISNL